MENWTELHLDRWEIPFLGNWEFQELEQLAEAASENGVQVSGDTFEAISVSKAVGLERANRLILHVYRTKSFQEYLASLVIGSRLPYLDIDNLDPENLKLVKIDLPEEDWYQLTLE